MNDTTDLDYALALSLDQSTERRRKRARDAEDLQLAFKLQKLEEEEIKQRELRAQLDFQLAFELQEKEASTKPGPSTGSVGLKSIDSDVEICDIIDPEKKLLPPTRVTSTSNDLQLARILERELNEPQIPKSLKTAIVSREELTGLYLSAPELETLDPNPDIWSLFVQFDEIFFDNVLTENRVELEWSKNPGMIAAAGLCAWNPVSKCASIKLSTPLLALRPRADLVDTLLHEMIHAHLFVTHQDDNHESHGNCFHHHMRRINRMARTHITVYHTFHDEVMHLQMNQLERRHQQQNTRNQGDGLFAGKGIRLGGATSSKPQPSTRHGMTSIESFLNRK